MAVFLGACVALCFGTGDFLGGFASRRTATLTILLVAQLCAFAGSVVYALAFAGDPTGQDLALGASAGALNVGALGLLYHGLATGRMSVVAPVTAVVAAVVPVAWGLATGERPSPLALGGVVAAVAAGGLIARAGDDRQDARVPRELGLAVTAGLAFGASFVLYAETGDDSGFWPVLAGRSVALPLVALAVLATRAGVRSAPRERAFAAGAGLLDVTATALLLLAVREGLSSLVAPIAALGPAFTVGWARVVLAEPLARIQAAGLALAFTGLVLIAAG